MTTKKFNPFSGTFDFVPEAGTPNWNDIVGKPSSSPANIDDAVTKKHSAHSDDQDASEVPTSESGVSVQDKLNELSSGSSPDDVRLNSLLSLLVTLDITNETFQYLIDAFIDAYEDIDAIDVGQSENYTYEDTDFSPVISDANLVDTQLLLHGNTPEPDSVLDSSDNNQDAVSNNVSYDETNKAFGSASLSFDDTLAKIDFIKGILTSTADNPSFPANRAMDGKLNWNPWSWLSADSGSYPIFIKLDAGSGHQKIYTSWEVLPYWDSDVGASIKDFTIQGSNNDSDWDILHTAQALNQDGWQTFNFSNTTAYRYYQIVFTSAWWDGQVGVMDDQVSIAEMDFLEDTPEKFDLGTDNFLFAWSGRLNNLPVSGGKVFVAGKNALTIEEAQDSYLIQLVESGGSYQILFGVSSSGSGFTDKTSTSFSLTTGTFYRFAIQRLGDTLYFFVDGVAKGTASLSGGFEFFKNYYSFYIGSKSSYYTDYWYAHNSFGWDGQIDEFVFLRGTGDYSTFTDIPAGEYFSESSEGLTLISDTIIANSVPTTVKIATLLEEVDSITLNTDLKIFISRDDGITYTQGTLINKGIFAPGVSILTASVDVSSQPSDTNIRYKFTSHNDKDFKLRGSCLSWI